MQWGVAKGLKVPCLFMITEVSIRCQKNPGGWYMAYTRVYPPPIHHCLRVDTPWIGHCGAITRAAAFNTGCDLCAVGGDCAMWR